MGILEGLSHMVAVTQFNCQCLTADIKIKHVLEY